VEFIKHQMAGSENSPILARAPLLLSESLLFPYREGLSFEQDIWMDRGQAAAFAGALDRPPSSSWEIMNPRQYEQGHVPSVPYLPDIHPIVDKTYRPYDIGQVGQLDVHILSGLFGGDGAARDLTPAWDGGIYWAGQRLNATAAEQATTKSISLFYLSVWKDEASAQAFSSLYSSDLSRKYSGVKAEKTALSDSSDGSVEQVWTTNEGPVVITRRGKMVFVSESFDLPIARKLADLILSSQGSGALESTHLEWPQGAMPVSIEPGLRDSLTDPLVRLMSNCGVSKAVVDAGLYAGRSIRISTMSNH
jgi:GH43 family beta-xylosidase